MWKLRLGKKAISDAPPESKDESPPKRNHRMDRLRLESLHGPPRRPQPLKDCAVLDLCCEDLSLCAEAVKQGASRVVGVVKNKKQLSQAQKACPSGIFYVGDCNQIPDEMFDVVFLLSDVCAREDMAHLFAKVKEHLNPKGRFVLETGYVGELSSRCWTEVREEDELKRVPSMGMLYDILLKDYSVRHVSSGGKKRNDAVRRAVLHCTPLVSTALLIAAPGNSGKTTLARQFLNVGWPDISTDRLLGKLARDPYYAWRPAAKRVRDMVGKERPDWGFIGKELSKDSDFVDEFCSIIAAEAPVESLFFYIEGAMLTHANVMECLTRRLKERGVRLWVVKPG
ncbi:methyltransferase domain-containing protein [Aquibaculum arenosum]|uniref:Class I SAM-dependent methyltransferase n=1 Tax=Aquibaculum arenosum TaxID=3032591 RepID=A0ABT5YN42_9PROT|nr:class I SAM-dependent methyltransferase [Fodinicurvata sp. CAU 1616]MDF2096160.1 class I SAM-dependent methyltransferase [Fodinicurvata sp. CAU 1616]